MQILRHLLFPAFFLFHCYASAQSASFKIIPLGIYGGSDESNLSSYMVSGADTNAFVCLDAGTLHSGIEKAILHKSIKGNVAGVLQNNIKGYLISHPHLDHLAGLVLNSPDDSPKNIYALPFCIDALQQKYFSWKSWANFGDAGEKPTLNKYHYVSLNDSEIALQHTSLFVKAFELSHAAPYKSTAFLLRNKDAYLLYLGDTGADTIEHANNLATLWQYISPLIQSDKLKGIFIETSFPDEQPHNKLFGHLTPSLLMQELKSLSIMSANKLAHVPIIITHIKPSGNNELIIKKQLQQENNLHLKLIFPKQGESFFL